MPDVQFYGTSGSLEYTYMIISFLVLGLCILFSFLLSVYSLSDDVLADHINMRAFMGMLAFWLLFHFVIVVGAFLGLFQESWEKVGNRQDLRETKLFKVSKLIQVEAEEEEAEEKGKSAYKETADVRTVRRNSSKLSGKFISTRLSPLAVKG